MSAPTKISPNHLSRKAMVYVRQSTMAQVREHTESTARQYALVEEAARLGWAAARIEVIDCDLGLSGRSADHRSGFRDLVSRVCLGEVGAIFGLEVSRLARSSADLARLTDTLIIDADGIYDLRDFNDRLLLGLAQPGRKSDKSPRSPAAIADSTDRVERVAHEFVGDVLGDCRKCDRLTL